jgi:hypothetical protein
MPRVPKARMQPIKDDAPSGDSCFVALRIPVLRRLVNGEPVALPTKHFNRPLPASEVRTLCDIRDGLRAIGAGPIGRNGRPTPDPTHWDVLHWLLQQVAAEFRGEDR